MCSAHHAIVDPCESDCSQLWPNIAVEDVFASNRRCERLGRKEPALRTCIRRGVQPQPNVGSQAARERCDPYGLRRFGCIDIALTYPFHDVCAGLTDSSASQPEYLTWSHAADYSQLHDQTLAQTQCIKNLFDLLDRQDRTSWPRT